MRKMDLNRKIIVLLVAVMGLFSSCSSDFWFDFLLGPQPKFIDDTIIEPALNIFGVARPDSIDNIPMSFVLVEKLIPAVNSEPESFEIRDALVEISLMDAHGPVETHQFYLDSAQIFPTIYRPVDFTPKAGETYSLYCESEGLPILSAQTTMPHVPIIKNGEISVSQGVLSFIIEPDSVASLYDVYLFSNGKQVSTRVFKTGSDITPISLGFNFELSDDAYVSVYAYDSKLADYVTYPNVFIKPNTYRPPFSNVSGGYGGFGSMNILVQPIF